MGIVENLVKTMHLHYSKGEKGASIASIKRKPRWDILDVFPIWALD